MSAATDRLWAYLRILHSEHRAPGRQHTADLTEVLQQVRELEHIKAQPWWPMQNMIPLLDKPVKVTMTSGDHATGWFTAVHVFWRDKGEGSEPELVMELWGPSAGLDYSFRAGEIAEIKETAS